MPMQAGMFVDVTALMGCGLSPSYKAKSSALRPVTGWRL
jgi:hypothetical protein